MELRGARVLALGTRGAQGTGLVQALEARGAVPVLGTSDAEQVTRWQQEGRQAVRVDLRDPASLPGAARDVDAVAMHAPLSLGSPDGARAVDDAVLATQGAGTPVVLNVGTPLPPPGAPDPFGVGPRVQRLVAAGVVVVAPTGYLENHAAPWALGPLGRGELVYPRPPQDAVAWITARDVTAAAVAALAVGVSGEGLQLAGPQPLTFEQLAAEVGTGLGREVVFRRVTPQEYGDLLRPVLGDGAAEAVAAGYAAMPEGPNPLMTPDASATWQRLGVQPTPARDWAARDLAPLLQQVPAGAGRD